MCKGGCRSCGVIANIILCALALVVLAAALGGTATDDGLENVPWSYAELKGPFTKSETFLGLGGTCTKVSVAGNENMQCSEFKPDDLKCDDDGAPDFCDCIKDDNANGQTGAASIAFLGAVAALVLSLLRIEKCDGRIKKVLGIVACLVTIACCAAALGQFAANCHDKLKDQNEKMLDAMPSGESLVILAWGWWLELVGGVLALVALIVNAVLPIGAKPVAAGN